MEGRRVSVRRLRALVEERGFPAEEVAAMHDLDMADVYAALTCYHEHREEMAELEQQREALVQQSLAEGGNDARRPPPRAQHELTSKCRSAFSSTRTRTRALHRNSVPKGTELSRFETWTNREPERPIPSHRIRSEARLRRSYERQGVCSDCEHEKRCDRFLPGRRPQTPRNLHIDRRAGRIRTDAGRPPGRLS